MFNFCNFATKNNMWHILARVRTYPILRTPLLQTIQPKTLAPTPTNALNHNEIRHCGKRPTGWQQRRGTFTYSSWKWKQETRWNEHGNHYQGQCSWARRVPKARAHTICFSWVWISYVEDNSELMEFNNCPTWCDLFSLLYFCRQLSMFRV